MGRKSGWVWGGGLLLALGVVGCDIGQSCTDIGCESGVTVDLSPKTESWQAGQYELRLDLDDKHTTCSFEAPEDLVSQVCKGDFLINLTGRIDHIELRARTDSWTPKTVHVELSRDGASVLDESQTLKYAENQPNEGCAPICHRAAAAFVVD